MITLYNENDFKELKIVGMFTSKCLEELLEVIKPGITTHSIDKYVKSYAQDNSLLCATLGYNGYPAHCCTSVNSVAAHGIPSPSKVLKEGDIIKVDVTFIRNGYYGDSCRTYTVGKVSKKAEIITNIAREALFTGLIYCRPGKYIGDIGYAIQTFVEKRGASVVKELIGHGIGKKFHDEPEIPHWCKKENIHKTPRLVPGMVFCVEPIINQGAPGVKQKKDGWTIVTKDKSLSAQWESQVGITETGCEIFTPIL